MKKCIILFFVLFSAQIIKSQDNNKYIEVTVSDSAEINPDRILYQLNITNDMTYVEPDYTDDYNNMDNPPVNADLVKKKEEEKLKSKMNEKKLIDLLVKEKISFTRKNEESPYSYLDYNKKDEDFQVKGFAITFTSYDQMHKLLDKIPEDLKYNGHVTEISNSKFEQHEEEIIEKALGKSRKQAENIAKLSNVKLGNMIQYSDNEGDNLGKTIERLMYSMPKWYQKNGLLGNDQKITIIKTVRVRYSIE